jgi:hypothetical protein
MGTGFSLIPEKFVFSEGKCRLVDNNGQDLGPANGASGSHIPEGGGDAVVWSVNDCVLTVSGTDLDLKTMTPDLIHMVMTDGTAPYMAQLTTPTFAGVDPSLDPVNNNANANANNNSDGPSPVLIIVIIVFVLLAIIGAIIGVMYFKKLGPFKKDSSPYTQNPRPAGV